MTLDIGRQRLWNQGLMGNPRASPEQVVAWLCAVQSQDYHGAKWGLAQRTRNATSASIDQLFTDGRILRTHVLRPTWHFVLPADIRWLLSLTAPRVHAACASYHRKLELDGALFLRSQHLLEAALEGGRQCTRAELAAALADGGIRVSGNRLAFVLMRGELDSVLCSGGLRGKQFTYALLDERAPDARTLEREAALAELAQRYFASHGPASVQDFAWWSGLSAADARLGLEHVKSRFENASVQGRTYWFPSRVKLPEPDRPVVHLLPNYDEHIVAYKDHGPSFDDQVRQKRNPDSDTLTAHFIVRNGLVIGGWRRTLKKTQVELRTELLIPLGKADRAAVQAAAEDYGRFLGLSAILT